MITFVLTLGIFFLGVVASAAASIDVEAAMSGSGLVGEPQTVTTQAHDEFGHAVEPDLVEVDCGTDGTFSADATGNPAECVYQSEGLYNFTVRVTKNGESGYGGGGTTIASQADKPGIVIMLTTDAVSLPKDIIRLQSDKPKPLSFSCHTAGSMACDYEYLGATGPDAEGKYVHSFRIPVAAEGVDSLEINATFFAKDQTRFDRGVFTLDVVHSDLFQLHKAKFLTCAPDGRSAKSVRIGDVFQYYMAQSHQYQVRFRMLRQTADGDWKVAKTIKQQHSAGASYVRQDRSFSFRFKRAELDQSSYKLQTTLAVKGFYEKTKTTRIKPTMCT